MIYIPLDRSIVPVVSTGDKVGMGELVARREDIPVYSSVSGVVKGVAREGRRRYLAVESDKSNKPCKSLKGISKPLGELSYQEICILIRDFAIIDGSDGEPLFKKLLLNSVPLKRIIINCCEHDSYGTSLYRLISEKPKELIGGAKILMHALGVKKCVFVIEGKKRSLISSLEKHINDPEMFVSAYIQQKYPVNEKTVISAVYGKEIPHEKGASDIGYILLGAEAIIQTYSSFVSGIPQVSKTLTVSGESISLPSNLIVPIGTPIKNLIQECGGISHKYKFVVKGGVMDGESMDSPGGVVTAYTNQLLFLRWADSYRGDCIRCGRCISVCPMHLSPIDYAISAEHPKKGKGSLYGINACIECGCCEYICPTGVQLLDIIRAAKKTENSKNTAPTKRRPVRIKDNTDDIIEEFVQS